MANLHTGARYLLRPQHLQTDIVSQLVRAIRGRVPREMGLDPRDGAKRNRS